MKIELRNIKHFAAMSEETNAFAADVWVDGKKVGTAENTGKGGCNDLRMSDRALEQRMYEWAKAQPHQKTKYGVFPVSIDSYLGDIVEQDLVRKIVQRLMKKRVLVINAKGQLEQSKVLAPDLLPKVREAWAAKGLLIATEEEAMRLIGGAA